MFLYQCRRTSGAPYWHGVGYFTTYSVGKDGKAFFDPQGLPGVAVTKGKDHLVEYALGKVPTQLPTSHVSI